MHTITPTELRDRLASGIAPLIVDVREPDEWEAVLLPLATVRDRIAEVAPDKSKEIVLHCARGGRSAKACQVLEGMGYTNVKNLEGGYLAYQALD
jgi:rhodanese-related sulfurtransferase